MDSRTYTIQNLLDLSGDLQINQNHKILKIDCAKNELSDDQFDIIVKKLERCIDFLQVQLINNKTPNALTEAQVARLNAIATRNQLIFELLVPIESGANPWHELMRKVLDGAYFGSTDSFEYNKSSKEYPRINRLFLEMGLVGLEKFFEFVLSKNKKLDQFNLQRELGAKVTAIEVLKCLNRLQEKIELEQKKLKQKELEKAGPEKEELEKKEFYRAFPFKRIVLNCDETLAFDDDFEKVLSTFLQKNTELIEFELNAKNFLFTSAMHDVIHKLKAKGIRTKLTVPSRTTKEGFNPGQKFIDSYHENKHFEYLDQKTQAPTIDEGLLVSMSPGKDPDHWWRPLPQAFDLKSVPKHVHEQVVEVEAIAEAQMMMTAEQDHQASLFAEQQLDFKPDFYVTFDEAAIRRRSPQASRLFDAIVGSTKQKDWKIDRFTDAAWRQIEACPNLFWGGFVYDPTDEKNTHLPEGFGIVNEGGDRIVYFDSRLLPRKAPAVPLSSNHDIKAVRPSLNGSVDFFTKYAPLSEVKNIRQAYKTYIQCEAKDSNEAINALALLMDCLEGGAKNQLNIQFLQQQFSLSQIYALRGILQSLGASAILEFLKNCQDLSEKKLFHSFRSCFMNEKVFDLIELHSPGSQNAIKYLVNLNEREQAWWDALVNATAGTPGAELLFVSNVRAFRAFCDELVQLGIDLATLPLPHELAQVKNINVTLNYILLILKRNPARALEQLENLKDIDLGNDGAYYAVRQGYHFVTYEMELEADKSCDKQSLNYVVEHKKLLSLAMNAESDQKKHNQLKSYFYRYLATSNVTLKIADIRKISNAMDKAMLANELLPSKALLYPIIAKAIEGPFCNGLDNEHDCENLLTAIKESKNPEPYKLVTLLLQFSQLHSNFTLHDLTAFVYYHTTYPDVEIKWPAIQKLGPEAYKVIVKLGMRAKGPDAVRPSLSFSELMMIADRIKSLKGLPQEDIFLALGALNIDAKSADQWLKQLSELKDQPMLLKKILKTIQQIDCEKSTVLPTGEFIVALIAEINDGKKSLDGISNEIRKQFNGVQFYQMENRPYTESDFRFEVNEIKKLVLEAVKSFEKKARFFGIEPPPNFSPEIEQELKEEVPPDVRPSDLLKELDQAFAEIPENLEWLVNMIFGKYQPYRALYEICVKKITADFKRLSNEQKISDGLCAQVFETLGPIDFGKRDSKSRAARQKFFEQYEFYKNISNKMFAVSNQPAYITFCRALVSALQEEKSSDNKHNIFVLVGLLFDKEGPQQDFPIKARIFKLCLKVGLSRAKDFFNFFFLIKDRSQASAELLLAHFETMAVPDNLFELNQSMSHLINTLSALPFATALIQRMLRLPPEHYLRILQELRRIDGLQAASPAHKKLYLQLLHKILIKEPKASIEDLLKCLRGITEEKLEAKRAEQLCERFENTSCPPLALFLTNLNAHRPLEEILALQETKPQGERNIKAQFEYDKDNLKRLLRIDCFLQEAKSVDSLAAQFEIINEYGRVQATLATPDLQLYLKKLIASYREQTTQKNLLKLIACLREVLYRTPPHFFANEMQILSVLTSFDQGQYKRLGIDTGQGKGVVCALQAAILHSLGHTVVVLTSERDLSKRDFAEFQAFFEEGLGAKTSYLEKSSIKGTFKPGGINYATTSDFALYAQAAIQRQEPLRLSEKDVISTIIDEDDDLTLNKAGRDQFILSSQAGGNNQEGDQVCWVYDHINLFVDFLEVRGRYLSRSPEEKEDIETKETKETKETIEYRELGRMMLQTKSDHQSDFETCFKLDQKNHDKKLIAFKDIDITKQTFVGLEVYTLQRYLLSKAQSQEQKQQLKSREFLNLLKRLIQSGKYVKNHLYATHHNANGFQIKRCSIEAKRVSLIEILIDGQPIEGLQYGQGQHQLLARRLEKDKDPKFHDDQFPFLIEPLRRTCSVWDTQALLSFFQDDPRSILLGNSGSPGSLQQAAELQATFGFKTLLHPPQQPKDLKTLPDIFAVNAAEQVNAIGATIKQEKGEDENAQPWLVHCRDIDKANHLATELKQKGFTVEVLTAQNKAHAKTIIDGLQPNQILISTISGRGTHFEMQDRALDDSKDRKFVLKHSKGLGVIELDLVPETVEQQGRGRGARQGQPGTYRRIFDMQSIKTNYPRFKNNLDNATLIKNIQAHLESEHQFQRERDSMYYQLALIMQQQLDRWQQVFIKQFAQEQKKHKDARQLEKTLNDLLEMRQHLLEEFAERWQEIPILSYDKLKGLTRGQQISFLHDGIKCVAVELWENCHIKLMKKWSSMSSAKLSDDLSNWGVLRQLFTLRRKYQVSSPEIKDEKTALALQVESKHEVKKHEEKKREEKKRPPVSTHLNYDRLMKLSDRSDPDLKPHIEAKIRGKSSMGQDLNFLTGCKKENTRLVRDYSSWFSIGKDRKRAANDFIRDSQNADTHQALLKNINISLRSSLDTDSKDANTFMSYYFFCARSTTSRYRNTLIMQKLKLLTHCSSEELPEIIIVELNHVVQALTIELQRKTYKQPELQPLKDKITSLITSITQNEQKLLPIEQLTEVSNQLKGIINSTEYNAKRFTVKELLKPLQYLKTLTAASMTENPLSVTAVKQRLNSMIMRLKISEPVIQARRTWSDFFRRRPGQFIFPHYDQEKYRHIVDDRARFKMHCLVEKLSAGLIKAFHTIELKFELGRADQAPGELTVFFKVLDRLSGKTTQYTLTIQADLDRNLITNQAIRSRRCEYRPSRAI